MGLKSRFIWFNGEMVPWEEATVHVLTHALHYGSSVFEGLRAYDTTAGPAIFRLRDHTRRLVESARIHRLESGYTEEEIDAACREVIRANGLRSAYIRPLVFRGFGDLALMKTSCPIEIAIAAFEWGPYLGQEAIEMGIDVCVSSWHRPAPNTFPSMAKAGGNYLSSQLIGSEANRLGYAEGIALDHNNYVSEGSAENIFLVRDGVLYTPPIWCSILPGLTRDSVMVMARDLGYEVREEPLPREALYVADELFFTGTAAEVTPIRTVDGFVVGSGRRGPVTTVLQRAFFDIVNGRAEDRWDWLDYVTGPVREVTESVA